MGDAVSNISIERVGSVVKLWVSTDLPFDDKNKNSILITAFSYDCDNIQHAELFKQHLQKKYKFQEKEK